MTARTVLVGSLVEDLELYPRHTVDGTHVADLANALLAGTELPTILVEDKTLRLVDGVHRRRALLRVYGPEHSITVDARTYRSDRALLEDAVRLNSGHGRRFDRQDQTRSALLLRQHGVAAARIAVTLQTTTDRVEQLLANVVLVRTGRKVETFAAKPIVRPVGGQVRTLSAEQYATARSSSGWSPKQTLTQLANELRAGVLDLSDVGIVERLWMVYELVGRLVPPLEKSG